MTRDGRLVVDEPQVRDKLANALGGYTALHRKGCNPTRCDRLEQLRQQQGLPDTDGRHVTESEMATS